MEYLEEEKKTFGIATTEQLSHTLRGHFCTARLYFQLFNNKVIELINELVEFVRFYQ